MVFECAGAPDGYTAPAQHDRLDLVDLTKHLFDLPPLMREALVLVDAHGLSYGDGAAICEVSVGTLKARVSRARARLARAMEPLPTTGA